MINSQMKLSLEASEFLPIYEEVIKEYDEKEYRKELIEEVLVAR